jgi:hypothetical protein
MTQTLVHKPLAEILALASVDGEMRERLAADYGRLGRMQ